MGEEGPRKSNWNGNEIEATGNENVSTFNFRAIRAMQLNLSSKTRNSISPYPVAKFLPCTLPRVSRGSARNVFLVLRVFILFSSVLRALNFDFSKASFTNRYGHDSCTAHHTNSLALPLRWKDWAPVLKMAFFLWRSSGCVDRAV